MILHIKSDMPHPEWFAVDKFYLQQTLTGKTAWIFEAMNHQQNRMAVVVALYPAPESDHPGPDSGLPETEWPYIACMDIAATLPENRGNGLQCRLMTYAEKQLSAFGAKYLACTVHPDNTPSRKNIEAIGYVRKGLASKYGGLPRYIYLKKI